MSRPRALTSLARRTALIGASLAAAVLAAPAGAAGAAVLSSNWAGYVAHAGSKRFTGVSASWTIPAAVCAAGHETHSAAWVGLGGYRRNATALEQIGTDADCTSSGRASYSSWVELLPAAASPLRLRVSPGDLVTASVTVLGRHATLRLRDLTTGRRYSTTRGLSSIDVSTADWIVEAPSGCNPDGSCHTLDLTDFGTVAFSGATATVGGETGALGGGARPATELLLRQDAASASGARGRATRTVISATPSTPEAGSFSIAYEQAAGAQGPTLPTFPASGGEAP